ncbi:large conductance mechanosensitive channel [Methylocapsa palsarum]|uniref:Large-conductance mechanosensitive channel n=1 Tax=Methylocapsa palsarum TaxID=1612308 RepID=A0A1I3XL49_9HYPH|nr:large conductance mechanosensitive channel [Methylocapsa palsarum]
MEKILQEFKEFAMKGNVVDLAIGVIIGAAFGAIVTSLVGDIIMPLIGAATGGLDFSNHFIPLSKSVTSPVLVEAKKQGAVIGWGNFVTVALNFLIIAFVLFLAVRGINSLKKRSEAATPAAEPTKSEVLLAEIRDALAAKSGAAASSPSSSPARAELLLEEIRDALAKK